MADAVPIEQLEPDTTSSLEKIETIILPKIEAVRVESLERGNGFNLAKAVLLLAEADPELGAKTHSGHEMVLIAKEAAENEPGPYNTGLFADAWSESMELAALREVFRHDVGWAVNNPENSNNTGWVAFLRENFPEYITNQGLGLGLESQETAFKRLNGHLISLNRSGDEGLWWEKLDIAVNLAKAFPERAKELEIREVKNHKGEVIMQGKFWEIMKGMFDKAKQGELVKEEGGPLDLEKFRKQKIQAALVKSREGERTKIPKIEDRFLSNKHAELVIAASLISLFPERRSELGLVAVDVREAESKILHHLSFPFYQDTLSERFALGEMYASTRLLEKAFGNVSRFDRRDGLPGKPPGKIKAA